MKILFLNHSMRCGGAERVTANLANEWVLDGTSVAIATFSDTNSDFYELDERIERLEIQLAGASNGLIRGLFANVSRLCAVRQAIKRTRPDFVVGVMTVPSILAILAAIGLNTKVIVTEHNHPPMLRMSAMWEHLRRLTFRHAASVIALTKETANWLERNCRCKNVRVIPNPVAVSERETAPVLRPNDVVQRNTQLLLAVGRLTRQKGFDLLIEAFSRIHRKVPSWQLAIVGEGELRADLEKMVVERQLGDSIVLPGRAGNIIDWYRRADLYVLSSRFEGFSLTLAEAMANGCPAISYDCDVGPRDIIRDGVDGRLVSPPGDVAALADELLSLMTDEPQRLQFAKAASDVAVRFAPDRIANQWRELFVSLSK